MTANAGPAVWGGEADRALSTLGRDEQAFIRLSYFTGLGHVPIAADEGVPVSAVARTIACGMQKFGRAMPDQEVEPSRSPGSERCPGET